MSTQDEQSLTVISRLYGAVVGAISLSVIFLFFVFGEEMRGQATASLLGSGLLVHRLTHKYWTRLWYKVYVILLIITIFLVAILPDWPHDGFSTVLFFPIFLVLMGVMLGLFFAVRKFFDR